MGGWRGGAEGAGAPYVANLRKTKESGIWLRAALSRFEFERRNSFKLGNNNVGNKAGWRGGRGRIEKSRGREERVPPILFVESPPRHIFVLPNLVIQSAIAS